MVKSLSFASESLLSEEHISVMRKGAQQHFLVLTNLARVVQNPCSDLYTGRFYFHLSQHEPQPWGQPSVSLFPSSW